MSRPETGTRFPEQLVGIAGRGTAERVPGPGPRTAGSPSTVRVKPPIRGRALVWAVRRLLVVTAVLGLAACGDDTVAIGVGATPNMVQAARMAVEDALAEAPVPGLDTVMVPESTPRTARSVGTAGRFVEVPGIVAVVGHAGSPESLAASQIYNRHGIVQIAPAATAPVYSQAGPYSFRLVPPDDQQGALLAEKLSRLFPDGARLSVHYVSDDYGRGLRESVLDHLDRAFDVVLDLPHSRAGLSDGDLEYTAAALADARPDAVLWLSTGDLLIRALGQIRKVLGDVPVIAGDAVSKADVSRTPDLGATAWTKVWYVEFFAVDGTEARRAFVERYRRRFGVEVEDREMLSYDAVRLIIAGIREGARSPDELRVYLMSLGRERPPYPGLTGPIAFKERGDADRSLILYPTVEEAE